MCMVVDVGIEQEAVLKALAEPRRWQIVELLSCEELCVCHMVEELDMAQPLMSHHLKVLREAGIVESEKHRQRTYYRLRPGALEALGERIRAIPSFCQEPGERRRPSARRRRPHRPPPRTRPTDSPHTYTGTPR